MSERLRDPDQRAERGTRILDTAADLLLRHGYRRVTIDDVAASAGIGKGTVYLHWKTRDQLFGAVLTREVGSAIEQVRQALLEDPQACRLHRFARAYFLAITSRPLLLGFLLADPELLGKLTGSPDREERHAKMGRGYLELLAGQCLLRADLDVDQLGYAYQATFEGFLRAEAGAPADGREQRADLLAVTVRRAFESDTAPSDAALRDLATAVATLFGDVVDADRAEAGIPSA
ncbi:helix-turn-helix domain-containing protein [Nonomuraea sp. NPDC049784]|uniref:TetR/AcrR family transcriptional regulator n=1 Tax=Nonomuraea sp. NPDC049784 TaxID=3154361 RepID=UPI0033E3D9C4